MNIKNEIETKGNKFMQVSSSYKLVEYTLVDYNKVIISDELMTDMLNLPDTYDARLYSQFIDKWGTHYREKIVLGGRLE